MSISRSLVVPGLLALSILSLELPPAAAQVATPGASPTAVSGAPFLYRGHLRPGGVPADGSYNLTFSLYDTGEAGAPIAGPITRSAVAVHHGEFAVTLDFGAGPFTAKHYWLEIKAAPGGGTTFVEAVPRAPLRPSPWAHGPQGVMHHEEPLP